MQRQEGRRRKAKEGAGDMRGEFFVYGQEGAKVKGVKRVRCGLSSETRLS